MSASTPSRYGFASTRNHAETRGVRGGWLAWAFAALTWLAFGCVTGYWVLRWVGTAPNQALPVASEFDSEVDSQAVARALGWRMAPSVAQPQAQSEAGARYSLKGVLAATSSQGDKSTQGVALISIDGQRALAARAGTVVDGQWVVQSVGARSVVLAPGSGNAQNGPGLTLRLPAPDGAVVQ